jgi:hypothetical protein
VPSAPQFGFSSDGHQVTKTSAVVVLYHLYWFSYLRFQKLQESKQRLEALARDLSKKLLWKRTSRKVYRFLLADEILHRTGDFHLELATLIESAHAAHGESEQIVNVATLNKGIDRFMKSIKAKVIAGRLCLPSGQNQRPLYSPNPIALTNQFPSDTD